MSTVTPGSGCTPASVHHGTATEIRAQRLHTLDAAHAAHPERFGNRRPQAPKLPKAAWINQPSPEAPHTSHTAGR
jgi:putative transposase